MAESHEFPGAYAFEVSLSTPEFSSEASVQAIFKEASGISEKNLDDLAEGGESTFVHRLPKQTKQRNLVLKRGVIKASSPLSTWVSEIMEAPLGSTIVTRPLIVDLVEQPGKPIVSWIFHEAWPVKWSVDPLTSTKDDIEVETLEFSYKFVERILPTV